jgi:cytochrome P450
MSPAVGGLLPREVLKGGLAIPSLGLQLPAGIDVGVPTYAIHHHVDFVVEPFRFDPERWLTTAQSLDVAKHPQDRESLHAVFNPFSVGLRACLGKPLVYMELSIALARMFWEFDMRLAADQHVSSFVGRDIDSGRRQAGEYQLLDWFMSHNEGPWAEIRRRDVKA